MFVVECGNSVGNPSWREQTHDRLKSLEAD